MHCEVELPKKWTCDYIYDFHRNINFCFCKSTSCFCFIKIAIEQFISIEVHPENTFRKTIFELEPCFSENGEKCQFQWFFSIIAFLSLHLTVGLQISNSHWRVLCFLHFLQGNCRRVPLATGKCMKLRVQMSTTETTEVFCHYFKTKATSKTS